MPAAPELERVPFTGLLVAFAGELRAAGLAVGSGDVLLYCSALSRLNPADLVDLYWAGRTTLVNRHDDIAVYDRVFRRFFLAADEGASDPLTLMLRASAEAQGALAIPSTEPGESEHEDDAILGWMASDVEALKHKSFAACTPEELAALRRIMARIKLTPPRRRTRRSTPARTGPRPDPRRTVRETMRMHGEPARLYWRRRKVRLRPLILILDVSGSMADYSRSLLQFAHSAARSAGRVEVFCFGTRLTRVTAAMDCRNPDEALERAARAVVRLGRRDQDRRQPGRLRPGLGAPRYMPGRHRGGLLRRLGPRGSRGACGGAGAADPAVPPAGVAEPAQGRRPGLSAQHPRDDDRGPAHRPAAVRPRSEQPGETRYSPTGLELAETQCS